MKLRDFADTTATRKAIYKGIRKGFYNAFPIEGKKIKLRIEDVEIKDKHYTKEEQRQAILKDKDLTVPVKGTMVLEDRLTGKTLQKRKMTLGQAMYYTPNRGTMIGNGVEYSPANQMRLMPGAYTRIKTNDDIETQFNVEGKMGFRVAMEPKTGIFKMNVGNNKLRLYPILKSFNVPDSKLKEAWGKELLEKNIKKESTSLNKLYGKLAGYKKKEGLNDHEKAQFVLSEFKNLKLDPNVTNDTLGERFGHVNPRAILKATNKIIKVHKGDVPQDDRDSLKYKSFWGVEDFVRERIDKDSGQLAVKLKYKLDKDPDLDKIPSGYFSKYLKQIVRGDQRAFPFDQMSPSHYTDSKYKVIVTGEGGIGNMDLITPDARDVNESQFGFIDPIRGPENEKIGIDTRLANQTFKGDDKKIYARVFDAKTHKKTYLNPVQRSTAIVAFPGEILKKDKKIRAMKDGKVQVVDKKDVQYYIKDGSEMTSFYSTVVPMISAVAGMRTLMAGKAFPDVLSLVKNEAPLVRTAMEEDPNSDFETHYGKDVLTEFAPVDGVVKKITKKEMLINDGKKNHRVELYDNLPMGIKTALRNIPTVKLGQKVKAGQIVAKSNYTDEHGTFAQGTHLTTAYMPYKGITFEDGIAISESAQKAMTSEQVYKVEVPLDEHTTIEKNKYISSFPSMYNQDQTENIDKHGLIAVGSKVNEDDPLILAVKRKTLSSQDLALGKLHKSLKNIHSDTSAKWSHGSEGEVIDVVLTGKKAKVYIKTQTPAEVGDKITGRYGNKGVIAAVIPDAEMPLIKRTGERVQVMLNPMGVVSRTNPAQIFEGLLGKIAKEKGKIYRTPLFSSKSYVDMTRDELKKAGIPDQEHMEDPDGTKLKAMVTNSYFYKLSKLSESIVSDRFTGSYTANMQPAKGKFGGKAIKMGPMESDALRGAGAIHNLSDVHNIKGQKNSTYWNALMTGMPTPSPDVPFTYEKFRAFLKGAGANVEKRGDQLEIKPMTDKETLALSNGEIRNPKFLSAKTLDPEKGGFFDIGLTGGAGGSFWNHINLSEPMPNPIMEQPIKTLLDLNDRGLKGVIGHKQTINGISGTKALKAALGKINVDKEIKNINDALPNAKVSEKNAYIKKLKVLKNIKATKQNPEDMMISSVPVLPPVFRPIYAMSGTNAVITSDPNLLYRDLMYSNKALNELKKDLPEEDLGEEKINLYNTLKATTGFGPHINPEFKKTNVKSLMKYLVGDKPKSGFIIDKALTKTQDLVGRAVATPDSTLDLDEVGLPEKVGWTIFKPFVMRNLARRGLKATKADEEIEKKSPLARSALDEVIKERPVLINRAPSLHKFSIIASKVRLHKDNSLKTNPMIEAPMNLDHDGDALQIHVPVSEGARLEALNKMMPSQNLNSLQDYRAHYVPRQEDQMGLWIATTKDKKNKAKKVKDVSELKMLLKSRKLNFNDRISIGSKFK